MKLIRETGEGAYRIRAVEPGRITINDDTYTVSVILSLDTLYHPWPVSSANTLGISHLEPVFELEPEIVLLGTGAEQQFPAREVMRAVLQRGIGIEVMDTASACRTFNVLMAEGRRIVAALMV